MANETTHICQQPSHPKHNALMRQIQLIEELIKNKRRRNKNKTVENKEVLLIDFFLFIKSKKTINCVFYRLWNVAIVHLWNSIDSLAI